MDERFIKFIKKHHVLTLATVNGEGMPYVANCFYAYDTKRNLFVFTSDLATTRRASATSSASPMLRLLTSNCGWSSPR